MLKYDLQYMNECSSKKKFNVVSMFAGGGGSSVGYKLAGGNVILANEISKSASKIYSNNHPYTKLITDNIKNFNPSKMNLGEVDILDGSPPCITFSVAKATKRELEIEENPTETLVLDFVRVAKQIKPKICVIENVIQFQNAPVFNQSISWLEKFGYIVNFKILDAQYYGVAQRRKRLFIIGIRSDIANRVGILSKEQVLDLFPEPNNNFLTVRDALHQIKNEPHEREFLLNHMRKSSHYEVLKAIPKNPPKKTRMSMIRDDWNSDFSLDRSSWDNPSPTITSLGQMVGQGGIAHPNEDRLFTIKELNRLMGLPDDYVMSGTYNDKAKAVGNMVSPPVMSSIAKSLYEKVIKETKPKKNIHYIRVKNDYGYKETLYKYKGKFINENELDEIISVSKDTMITTPTGIPIAWVITNVFPDDEMRKILYSIDETSVMRSNCAGPIDKEQMSKMGMIEGKDYKLRTPNSYFPKKKNGEWNKIAIGNKINSAMIGAMRGRFTGRIKISNQKLWEKLEPLTIGIENAFRKIEPQIYKKQKNFAELSIESKFRHGTFTTFSSNRYSENETSQMSMHIDRFDVGYTTMSCFREGIFQGGYFCFPRWKIGIDLPDNSVCIANSSELHGVSKIKGEGKRHTMVCYTNKTVATIPPYGQPEKEFKKYEGVSKLTRTL